MELGRLTKVPVLSLWGTNNMISQTGWRRMRTLSF